MKLSYVSDLHLEFLDYPDFSKEEGGDVLLLVGDIITASMMNPHRTDAEARKLQKYLKGPFADLLKKYTSIFYVLGNHEHYRSNFTETANNIQAAFKLMKLPIQLLDNTYVPIDNWTLIGCTLWTDYFKESPLAMNAVQYGMNDYRIIGADTGAWSPYVTQPIRPEFLLHEHKTSLNYIDKSIAGLDNVIVMTHMAPSLKSLNEDHCGNGIDAGYASDLSEFILDRPNIKYWFHGHTHMNFDYTIGNCRILSNQRGYRGESSYKKFNGLQHIEIV